MMKIIVSGSPKQDTTIRSTWHICYENNISANEKKAFHQGKRN